MALGKISALVAQAIDRYLVIAQLKSHMQRFIVARGSLLMQLSSDHAVAPYKLTEDEMMMRLLLARASADEQEFIANHIVSAELDYPKPQNCCVLRVEFSLDRDLPADMNAIVSLTYQLDGGSVDLLSHRLESKSHLQTQEHQELLFAVKYSNII